MTSSQAGIVPPATPMLPFAFRTALSHGRPSRTRITSQRRVSVRTDKTQLRCRADTHCVWSHVVQESSPLDSIHGKSVLAQPDLKHVSGGQSLGRLFHPPLQKLRNDVVSALQQSCNLSQGRPLGRHHALGSRGAKDVAEVSQRLRSCWPGLVTLVCPTRSDRSGSLL